MNTPMALNPAEDQNVQSMPDASPTKWHRAHTTWFFETFLLKPHAQNYREFDPRFGFLAAAALLDGKFGLAQYDNARWNDPMVRNLMGRLEIICDGSLNPRSPGGFPCVMRATGANGHAYLAEVLDPPGFSRHGLEVGEVQARVAGSHGL